MNKKKIELFLIVFYIIITLSIATKIEIPFNMILRWIIPFCLLCVLKKRKQPKNYKYLICIYVYSCLGIMYESIYGNNIYSFDFLIVSTSKYISYIYVNYMMYCLFFKKEQKEKIIIFKIIYIFLICISLIQIIIYLKNPTFGNFKGIYINQNMYSPIANITVMMSIYYFEILKKIPKLIVMLIIIINSYLILAAGSRMGILMLVCSYLFYVLIIRKKRKRDLLFIIFITFLLLYFFKNIDIPALDRLLGSAQRNGATGFSRGITWTNAIHLFKENKLKGWGVGSVYYAIVGDGFKGVNNSYFGIHSSYLLILIESGIFGSFFYIAYFLEYILEIKKLKFYIFNKVLFLLLLNLLFYGLVESFLFSIGNPVSVLFWIFLTMITSNKK